ncbi:hypothetical protein JTE90_001724 [Oedothorax gibbosus]|uniref:Uncharacterized protein n=1 Tax=Oedothorax gibbosus TaxID=931172 RepID=A0AAV6U1R5_9ARAC|nr:hypothetical protein JTE90_001724 [Oedothorax gibbosus]
MHRHHDNWQEWVLKDHYKFANLQSLENSNAPSNAEVEGLTSSPSIAEDQNEDVDYNVFLSRLALKMEVTTSSYTALHLINIQI